MSISQNYPLVNPSLSLDFANTKKLDPRITFSRPTSAVAYDGKTVAKAEENLLLNSVNPLNTGWSIANGYAGTLGSDIVTNGDFSSGTTGWTAEGTNTIAVVGGELEITLNTALFSGANTTYVTGLVIGKSYRLTATGRRGTSSSSFVVRADGNPNNPQLSFTTTSNVTQSLIFIAASTGTSLRVLTGSSDGTGTIYVDDISVVPLENNNAIAPDGTTTAVTATATLANATYTQSFTALANDYTFSVFLRRVTGTGDVQIQAGSGTYVTQTLTSSWARYTVTQTLAAGARSAGVRIVDSGDEIEIWGAQLEQRSTVTAYTPTTTQAITNYIPTLLSAPNNTARFDHNPVTGESLGLLVEEQRTNLFLRSDNFANASWTISSVTVGSNVVVAPDGTLTGDKLIVDNGIAASGAFLLQTISKAATSTTYAYSCYAKIGEFNRLQMYARDVATSANFVICTFSLVDGSVAVAAVVGGTFTAPSASAGTPVGNGWYRFTLVFTSSTETSIRTALYSRDSVITNGNGYSGIYLWGAQLEAGAFPTSYIKTVASQVTRSADSAVMSGSNFSSWYRADEGTLYGNYASIGRTLISRPIAQICDGSFNNNIQTYIYDNVNGVAVRSNPTTQADINIGAYVENTNYKNVIGYAFNNVNGSSNGSAATTDTSVIIPNGLDRLYIGCSSATSTISNTTSNQLNGTIKKISYYPKRLSNLQLQALTS